MRKKTPCDGFFQGVRFTFTTGDLYFVLLYGMLVFWTVSLGSVCHSSKLMEPEDGVVGTSDL